MSARTVINADKDPFFNLREVIQFRSLLRYLSLRDVYVRYKQAWMGFGWSVVRPLINMVIFGCISYLIDRPEDPAFRFLSVAAAVVFWQLISTAMTEVSNSLLANANILTKVYFPKVILPLSSLLVCLVDFAIAFALFLILYIILYGVPGWQIFFLPFVLLYGLVFAFGLGLFAAAGSVKYRDVKFILPFVIQILFYVSPVFISSSFVLTKDLPQWMSVLYQLNPLVLMLNAFKWCLFGTFDAIQWGPAVLSIAITLLLAFGALFSFNRFERSFADFI